MNLLRSRPQDDERYRLVNSGPTGNSSHLQTAMELSDILIKNAIDWKVVEHVAQNFYRISRLKKHPHDRSLLLELQATGLKVLAFSQTEIEFATIVHFISASLQDRTPEPTDEATKDQKT